jgi:hypothetical protein
VPDAYHDHHWSDYWAAQAALAREADDTERAEWCERCEHHARLCESRHL